MLIRNFKNKFSQALSCPREGWMGWLVTNFMKKNNKYLELAAVKLCKIKPNHRVLEIGFGPGIGLEAAYKELRDGVGKLYGIDISEYVVNKANKKFERAISEGKIELHVANVGHLPFVDDKFDRIFHCNCYYFWHNLLGCSKELHRVMKPGGQMVTTLNIKALQKIRKNNLLLQANIDPLNYMIALENSGFTDVRIEYLKYDKITYQAIFATAEKHIQN